MHQVTKNVERLVGLRVPFYLRHIVSQDMLEGQEVFSFLFFWHMQFILDIEILKLEGASR